jgi:hypothetical protein
MWVTLSGVINDHLSSIYRGDKCLDYNVCNVLVQPLHYNSTQSRDYYDLLEFTNVFVPDQSSVDMCPLPERPAMDLHRDVASGGNGTSSLLAPARPPSPTRIEPPVALLWSDLCHHIETLFKLVWIKVKRWSSVCEVRLRRGSLIKPSSHIPKSSPL